MKVALYYHISCGVKNGKYYFPSFFGVFLNALAQTVVDFYFIGHESQKTTYHDYQVDATSFHFISLGEKTPAWHRDLFHGKILKPLLGPELAQCNAVIVRSPSPLAPYFKKVVPSHKLYYLIVGDYDESVQAAKAKTLREWLMWKYVARNAKKFENATQGAQIMVNSDLLKAKYEGKAKSIFTLNTTTISKKDFYFREDTCTDAGLNILYAGRIDVMKGLMELVTAVADVKNKVEKPITLHIVGWEDGTQKAVENNMKQKARELGIADQLIFHGKKKVGPELFQYYKMADMYVIPSYHEGFPRTIWEAMANACPVIATKVGGIPNALKDKENALLIDPKSSDQISVAIQYLLDHPEERRAMIKAAFKRVEKVTLEEQSLRLINYLKHQII